MTKETWKQLAISVAALVVAMAGFWLVEASEYPTRFEVSNMIQKEAPYIADKSLILAQLNESSRINKELTHAVNDLRVTIARLQVSPDSRLTPGIK